jgi:hypothetical protein
MKKRSVGLAGAAASTRAPHRGVRGSSGSSSTTQGGQIQSTTQAAAVGGTTLELAADPAARPSLTRGPSRHRPERVTIMVTNGSRVSHDLAIRGTASR